MDVFATDPAENVVLSYDDPLPTEETTNTLDGTLYSNDDHTRSLADRIGSTKVYLLSDASKPRVGKRRHDELEDDSNEIEMDEGDSLYRENAILLHGIPISHLPTSNIFAYATHFDAHPLGLEWVDDTTCVLVFESKTDARAGYRVLQKSLAEEPSIEDGTITAKPIPTAIWPAEDRISATLGKGEGLKGIVRMRWARVEDVKKRGAKSESQFYKKYGQDAGKTFEEGPPPVKRRRPQAPGALSEAEERAKLDEELDDFLAEDEDAPPPSPPSKMRSDYIGSDGRTLLERTSAIRAHPEMESRVMADLPRRPRLGQGEHSGNERRRGLHDRLSDPRPRGGRGSRDGTPRERRPPRPKVTQEELDAELDAFLNSKD